MSATHVEVCERLAAAAAWPVELRRTHVNVLFGKSHCARQVTALIELSRRGCFAVQRVVSDFIGPEFADLFEPNVTIELRTPRRQRLFDRWPFVRFALKAGMHRLFRLMSGRPIRAANVVRGWVDTTDQVYGDLPEDTLLLVYPFAGSRRRQFRYLRRCWRDGRRVRFTGLPYCLADLARMAIQPAARQRILVESEIAAHRRHGEELADMGVKRLYTTDEFAAAGHALHEELIARGVWTTNRAHGAALYGPHVRYSHHRFLNRRQSTHYLANRGIDNWDFAPLPAEIRQPERHGACAVVFVCGNWRRAGKRYEAAFEERCLAHSARVCRDLGIPLYVRRHPNAGQRRMAQLCLRHGVQPMSAARPADSACPVFINTISSYYYDCLGHGPTIFLRDALLDPRELFGNSVQTVSFEGLAAELATLRNPAEWRRRTQTQLDAERRARVAEEGVAAGGCGCGP